MTTILRLSVFYLFVICMVVNSSYFVVYAFMCIEYNIVVHFYLASNGWMCVLSVADALSEPEQRSVGLLVDSHADEFCSSKLSSHSVQAGDRKPPYDDLLPNQQLPDQSTLVNQ